MNNHKEELEIIANSLLSQNGKKPNYSNRDFMNALIIFQTALMDKLYDIQDFDDMGKKERMDMAYSCGIDLKNLILTYTGLDTHKVEQFL